MFISSISLLSIAVLTAAAPYTSNIPVPRSSPIIAPDNITPIYKLPGLPYCKKALMPYLSSQILELHHDKHHKAYTDGLNTAIDMYNKAVENGDREGEKKAWSSGLFNEGGYINHSLFWQNLAPPRTAYKGPNSYPASDLIEQIEEIWGSVETFISKFNEQLATIQGSGWCWLVKGPDNELKIETKKNQDPILLPWVPIIGVDAWEHSYYLQYLNEKKKYFDAIWNVIDWDVASMRYKANYTKKSSKFYECDYASWPNQQKPAVEDSACNY